jgi:hypothetical protein
MMHGKQLAFLGVCLRSWRRLCTQKTGWPAEKAELEQALRVAQTSKDTEVRRVEKLQWEARLEAQARTARTCTHPHAPARTRTHPHAPARTCTHLHAPRTLLHLRAFLSLPRPCAPFALLCRRASPSSSTRCGAASSRGETARGTPSCTPRSAGACVCHSHSRH